MQLLWLWIVVLLAGGADCDSTFRFGAVLSTQGATKTMAEARNGYELFIDTQNGQENGRGFLIMGKPGSASYHFQYSFHWREDKSDAEEHATQLAALIEEERVHFIGGSHPAYAAEEMRLANASGVLNYQCCVGPDELYERDYATVFGVPASNREYTKMTIRTLSLQNIQGMAIVYDASNAFTRTTCEAAVAYSEEAGAVQASRNATIVRSFNETTSREHFYEKMAQDIKARGVEAVVACVFPAEGKELVNAIHDIRYPLKAFFLTTGPTKQEWVDSFDPGFRANDLLSSAQWHRDMQYRDVSFGSTMNYNWLYEQKFDGQPPTYNAAAASAVGVTLTLAIQDAFRHCDITKTKGDVDALLYDTSAIQCDDGLGERGYDRVLAALAELDTETFFGRVKFNYYRRNVGLDPVTTQVFERRAPDGNVSRVIEAVLPLGYATELLNFPAANHYREKCQPGYFQGPSAYSPCLPCDPGKSSDVVNAAHCDHCPIGEWTNLTAQSGCFKCPEGTQTEIRGAQKLTECRCKPGFFNLAGQLGVPCEPCPVGADCPGGTEMPIPLPGYWANETLRANIYQCSQPSVCKGGRDLKCEVGYTGRLCAQCENDYFSALNECYQCIHPAMLILLLLALIVGWYVINVTVSRSVTSLEMILGWAQLANIIGDINLNWTGKVTTVFGVANLLDFDIDILEPSCLVPWGFRENFISQLLLPFVMSTMAASGYLGSAIVYEMGQRNWIHLEGRRNGLLSIFVKIPGDKAQLQAKWDATVATFLASVDVTYVTIAKYCFDVFKCEPIAGHSVLKEAPDVLCGTAEHAVLIVLASFGVAFYVVGYLAYVFWKLYDLRDRRAFSDAKTLRRFGFVYEKFELDYYFTPAIILVRKLLFVLVLVYMHSPAFQIGVLAIIINISLMLQVYTAPYVDTYFDILFSFLLIALMFEAFGGLMFYSENLPDDNRRILEWLVITTLLILTVVFFAILCMEIAKKFCKRYLKQAHKKHVQGKKKPCGNLWKATMEACRQLSGWSSAAINALGPNGTLRDDEISFELLETFHPAFVYKSIRKEPDSIEQWHKLTNLLKDYMSDQSETSYLSMEPIAKFWRKLVDRFPELVDFLAVADEDTREKFKDVATSLYRNFYLTNKVTPLPLMEVMNWRDYAPMAQWLAIAPPEQRAFFLDVVAGMFKNNGNEEAAEILRSRLENGGCDPHLTRRHSIGRLNQRKTRILSSVSSGANPFFHSAAVFYDGDAEGSVGKESQLCNASSFETRDEEEIRPPGPITPVPSERCLTKHRRRGLEPSESRSSSSTETANREANNSEEMTSGRPPLDKQNSTRSTGSRTNKSVAFADEVESDHS